MIGIPASTSSLADVLVGSFLGKVATLIDAMLTSLVSREEEFVKSCYHCRINSSVIELVINRRRSLFCFMCLYDAPRNAIAPRIWISNSFFSTFPISGPLSLTRFPPFARPPLPSL